jgi:hypothetical protein
LVPGSCGVCGDGTNGSFAPAVSYPSIGIAVAIGDVNGDGKADLLTADPYTTGSNTTVSVFINNGDGTFAAHVDYLTTGLLSRNVVVGDLNGDGKADLVVMNQSNSSVFLNNGNGTFGAAQNITSGGQSIALGDLNGDGKLDLVIANYSNLSVLLGSGNGSFSTPKTYAAGTSDPRSIVLGDLNGDGKPDLAISGGSGSMTIQVVLNDGTGGFVTPIGYTTATNPGGVALGDLNGDGKLDVVFANPYGNNVGVMLNTGKGVLGAAQYSAVGMGPSSVAVGDLNGDGKMDIAALNSGDNTLSVLFYGKPGAAALVYPVASGPTSVALGDLNGDGQNDLVVEGNGALSVLLVSCKPCGTACASLDASVVVDMSTTLDAATTDMASPFSFPDMAGCLTAGSSCTSTSQCCAGYACAGVCVSLGP